MCDELIVHDMYVYVLYTYQRNNYAHMYDDWELHESLRVT